MKVTYYIIIIVPDAPSIDAVPLYSHESGHLVGIKTIFMELVSILQPAWLNELCSN